MVSTIFKSWHQQVRLLILEYKSTYILLTLLIYFTIKLNIALFGKFRKSTWKTVTSLLPSNRFWIHLQVILHTAFKIMISRWSMTGRKCNITRSNFLEQIIHRSSMTLTGHVSLICEALSLTSTYKYAIKTLTKH